MSATWSTKTKLEWLELWTGKLSSPTFKVLFVITCHANKDGIAWPGIEAIAAHIKGDKKQAKRGIAEAVEAGAITILRAGEAGSGHSARYLLMRDAPSAARSEESQIETLRRDAASPVLAAKAKALIKRSAAKMAPERPVRMNGASMRETALELRRLAEETRASIDHARLADQDRKWQRDKLFPNAGAQNVGLTLCSSAA